MSPNLVPKHLLRSNRYRHEVDAERLKMPQVQRYHRQVMGLRRSGDERVSHARIVSRSDCFGLELAGHRRNRRVDRRPIAKSENISSVRSGLPGVVGPGSRPAAGACAEPPAATLLNRSSRARTGSGRDSGRRLVRSSFSGPCSTTNVGTTPTKSVSRSAQPAMGGKRRSRSSWRNAPA